MNCLDTPLEMSKPFFHLFYCHFNFNITATIQVEIILLLLNYKLFSCLKFFIINSDWSCQKLLHNQWIISMYIHPSIICCSVKVSMKENILQSAVCSFNNRLSAIFVRLAVIIVEYILHADLNKIIPPSKSINILQCRFLQIAIQPRDMFIMMFQISHEKHWSLISLPRFRRRRCRDLCVPPPNCSETDWNTAARTALRFISKIQEKIRTQPTRLRRRTGFSGGQRSLNIWVRSLLPLVNENEGLGERASMIEMVFKLYRGTYESKSISLHNPVKQPVMPRNNRESAWGWRTFVGEKWHMFVVHNWLYRCKKISNDLM